MLHHFKGAYGPTIRIDTTTRNELLRVRKVFVDLAQGRLHMVNLARLDWITSINVESLILRRVDGSKQRDKTLERKQITSGKSVFHWSLPCVEWWARVNLVDGLLEGPGHQYLTEEDIDDAIVELAYGESKEARKRWST